LETEDLSLKFHPITEETPIFATVTYKDFLKNPGLVLGRYVQFEIPERTKKSVREEVLEAVRSAAAGVRLCLIPSEKAEEPPRTDITPAMHPSQAMASYATVNPPPDKARTIRLGIQAIDSALGHQ
jgi:hypothetical protein